MDYSDSADSMSDSMSKDDSMSMDYSMSKDDSMSMDYSMSKDDSMSMDSMSNVCVDDPSFVNGRGLTCEDFSRNYERDGKECLTPTLWESCCATCEYVASLLVS